MVREIREQAQLVYSIGASSRPNGVFPGFGVFSAGAPTEPHKVAPLVAKLAAMYEAFAAGGPTEDELAVAKKQVANTLAERTKDPAYWTGRLQLMTFRGASLDDLVAEPAAYQALTAAQVKATFERYAAKANSIVVVVEPRGPAAAVPPSDGGPATPKEPGSGR